MWCVHVAVQVYLSVLVMSCIVSSAVVRQVPLRTPLCLWIVSPLLLYEINMKWLMKGLTFVSNLYTI